MREDPAVPLAVTEGVKRLTSIDALRGIAALSVLGYHAVLRVTFLRPAGCPRWLTAAALPLSFGFIGVWLFFVISGFCIHMRSARAAAAGEKLEVEFWPFWKRRFRRLYPAYFAALLLYLGAMLVMHDRILRLDIPLHLLLIHNLSGATTHSINAAFWTLAVEEQLYLLYFALLALRTRMAWGWLLALLLLGRAGMMLLAAACDRYLHRPISAEAMALSQWFIWALGAISVEGWVGTVSLRPVWRDLRLAWLLLAAGGALEYLLQRGMVSGSARELVWYFRDPLLGVGCFVLVNRATALERAWSARRMWRALAGVGLFSYSLYLTHGLVVGYLRRWCATRFGWDPTTAVLVGPLVLAPASIAFAWMFFRLFERPFLTPAARGAANAAAIAAAPADPRRDTGPA